jgi:acetamidase/formamidase
MLGGRRAQTECHVSALSPFLWAERDEYTRVVRCTQGTFHKDNGGGFLTDHYPEATKACWDFAGVYCSSRHLPGVKFAGLIHPGLIGTAPSQALLDMWNERESALVCTHVGNNLLPCAHCV